MPGKLFAAELGQDAFPLRPTKAYTEIKASIGGKLKFLYRQTGVPAPAPEKPEHGDIDFAVCEPIGTVSPAQIQRILGPGVELKVEEGSRIAHFAVPVSDGNYGDLGMILGLLTRAHGLSLGSKGLKIHSSQADKTHPSSFQLSSFFPDILHFMGLSIKTWENGFNSLKSLFLWIQSSRFFVPRLVTETANDVKVKNMERRVVYSSFLIYARTLASSTSSKPVVQPSVVVKDALVFFGKKADYDAIVKANLKRITFADKFTGTHVMNWTGLYGLDVRTVMKGVLERLGEDGIVTAKVADIEQVTKEVQQKLNLYPK